MKVLSLQQPYAQLVVRGVKRVEVRGWSTDYRGRIAIHASSAVPAQEIETTWRTNRATALRFADQGWLDREDLKSLPRSAIVGTVLLHGIAYGRHQEQDLEDPSGVLTFNRVTSLFELAKRSKRTGQLVPRHTTLTPLPVPFEPDDYIWTFTDPIEIDPVTDVHGRQRLWTLPDERSNEVARGEIAALSGEWEPAPVNERRRRDSIRIWRAMWLSDLERDVIEIEERVERDREISRWSFDQPFEMEFLETWVNYLHDKSVEVNVDDAPVPLTPRMRHIFQGRETVPARELEFELRKYMQRTLEREAAEERARRRRRLATQRLFDLRKDPSSLAGKEFDEKPLTPENQVFLDLRDLMAIEEDGKEPGAPPPKPKLRRRRQ